MYKEYVVRLFPSKEQEKLFWMHINACRFIWNFMIDQNIKRLRYFHMLCSYYDMCYILSLMKLDDSFSWLYEVSNHSLQLTCGDLEKSLKRFKEKTAKFPKYKSKKKEKPSFPVSQDKRKVYFSSGGFIQIPKCGRVKCRFDYRKENIDLTKIRNQITNPRISLSKNGKWILTFGIECESQAFYEFTNGPLGIDMGIKEAATYSYIDRNGEVHTEILHNINKSKKIKNLDRKIKRAQRNISRKVRVSKKQKYDIYSSKRFRKEVLRLRKLYFHRSRMIKDEYNKFAHYIVTCLRPKYIILETLNLPGIAKSKFLSKEISDVNLSYLRNKIEYKGDRYNIPILYVPRNYPSSQLCSSCGNRKKMPLSSRTYVCPKCGMVLDRDVNASMNLMNYKDFRNDSNVFIINQKHV